MTNAELADVISDWLGIMWDFLKWAFTREPYIEYKLPEVLNGRQDTKNARGMESTSIQNPQGSRQKRRTR